MAIKHQVKARYESRNHEIVAGLRTNAGAGAPVDPHMKVKRLTAELATAMALIHGGDWRIDVDHQAQFVLIVPR